MLKKRFIYSIQSVDISSNVVNRVFQQFGNVLCDCNCANIQNIFTYSCYGICLTFILVRISTLYLHLDKAFIHCFPCHVTTFFIYFRSTEKGKVTKRTHLKQCVRFSFWSKSDPFFPTPDIVTQAATLVRHSIYTKASKERQIASLKL